ncbi:MAG TPA: hypothetical protein VGM18_04835 [Candidatus Sulfotelmatobacter sp.]|jgi:hypothetical protein
MPLQRIPNWRERLGQIIASAGELEFQWGVFDCALHVCNCIRAITTTAIDPGHSYRGTYSDEAGAAAIYGSSLEQFVAGIAATLALPEVAPTFARRGDLVFIDNGTAQGAIGIVSLDGRFASCASDKGLAMIRIRHWKRAWQIG